LQRRVMIALGLPRGLA